MESIFSFTVYGMPQPGGSKRAFAFRRKDGTAAVNVVDANEKVGGWKHEVAKAALACDGCTLIEDGPIAVTFAFYRTRPKCHYLRGGDLNAAGRAISAPTTKPDALKLARAAEDALTGVLWRDDAQIVHEVIAKRWGEPARLEVTVTPYDPAAFHT